MKSASGGRVCGAAKKSCSLLDQLRNYTVPVVPRAVPVQSFATFSRKQAMFCSVEQCTSNRAAVSKTVRRARAEAPKDSDLLPEYCTVLMCFYLGSVLGQTDAPRSGARVGLASSLRHSASSDRAHCKAFMPQAYPS